jgi:hypothetical protein
VGETIVEIFLTLSFDWCFAGAVQEITNEDEKEELE